MYRAAAALLLVGLAPPALAAERTPAPEDATATILAPEDTMVVTNPVTVVFGLSGMGLAPAGTEHENTGHYHLLIDVSPAAIDMNEPVPSDEQHLHLDGGESELEIELPEGTHTLRALLADHNHVPHDPPVLSEPVSVTIE